MNSKLLVGFGRADITPVESVPLRGYGNTSQRMSQNILSKLYATCVAFTDEADNTVLLFHTDLCGCDGHVIRPIREAISEATGVCVAQIQVSGTHTHSAPDYSNSAEPSIQRYNASLKDWLVEAAVEAMADRKSAKMYTGYTFTKKMNFVRHYLMNDGTIVGDNFGDPVGKTYLTHTSEADPMLQVVKFVREGGEDVLLVNWQAHPHRTGGGKKYDVSADIVGAMRDVLETETGCLFAYFTGGAGNVNAHSRIKEENITANYLEQGKALADYALDALSRQQEVNTGAIRFKSVMHRSKLNHTEDHKLEDARRIRDLFRETNDPVLCRLEAEKYSMHSAYHALSVIGKSTQPEYADVEMYAFSIGDVAFVTAPYEMFDANGKQIRDGSPFRTTFVVSCANDTLSYIPSALGYFHGCYGADCGKFHPGTGEELAQKYVSMLTELYENN